MNEISAFPVQPGQNPFLLLESHNLAQIPLDPMLGFLANIYASYVLHTHNGILLSHKKGQNFATYNNMGGLGGHYTK